MSGKGLIFVGFGGPGNTIGALGRTIGGPGITWEALGALLGRNRRVWVAHKLSRGGPGFVYLGK